MRYVQYSKNALSIWAQMGRVEQTMCRNRYDWNASELISHRLVRYVCKPFNAMSLKEAMACGSSWGRSGLSQI